MPNWIIATEWGARLVLILLGVLSVWSVAIMLDRRKVFRQVRGVANLDEAKTLIRSRSWDRLKHWAQDHPGLTSGAIRAAIDTGSDESEKIEKSVRSYLAEQRSRLENGLTVLATLGSNAPFIGLFGTVLGIIQAFGVLAASGNQASGGTATVMSAISEALIATAVGLFVAIPAVVAYNVYSRRLKTMLVECESLKDLYISRIGNAG